MGESELVLSLKARLFEMQNAAIDLCRQLREYEKMDKRSDDPRKSPIERIKEAHAFKKAEILMNEQDELEWSEDIAPEQVGLRPVWGDENGNLWIIVREGSTQKLVRLSGNR